METALADFIRDTPEGREADAILRSCVHCGFCTATCPTYQLLGDDLDSPRGRIYLIKQALEGRDVTAKTRLHLDRCLTCRSCETTCPSGVKYGRLLDIGRHVVDERAPRPLGERAKRWLLRESLLARPLFGGALALGRAVKPVLPAALRAKIPNAEPAGAWPRARHHRKMLVLNGCVQRAIAPSIDAATARVLDRIGISLLRVASGGCCGALPYHLSAERARNGARTRPFDAWWPHVDRDIEAIVVTASGCGVMVKEYGHLLRDDPDYAERAQWVSRIARDPVEVVGAEWPKIAPKLADGLGPQRVAFQSPCSLQHGMQLARPCRGDPARARTGAHAGRRSAPVLRLVRDVFAVATDALARVEGQQARGVGGGLAGSHRDRQHRLPHASCERNQAARAALDRVARRAHEGRPRRIAA